MAEPTHNWHQCNATMATQLVAVTYNPGYVYPYPLDALPANMQAGMPGLREAYVSGYCAPASVSSNFTGLGEFAVARTDGETGKGYNYAFGISSDGNVYYAGPCKTFQEHHWESSSPTPVEALFGHSGYYYSTTKL